MARSMREALGEGLGEAGAALAAPFAERALRLGVTGIAGAGKTVFITGLVTNLLAQARMPQFPAVAEGRLAAAFLQPQPDLTLPRFDLEAHWVALSGPAPAWPESTRALSQLRLSLKARARPRWFGARQSKLHLDLIDYPGEWLLDIGLLGESYESWSAQVMAALPQRPEAAPFLAAARAADGGRAFEESNAQGLAALFTRYLEEARRAGRADCSPGRFLLPGDLAGAPVLAFAPLPRPENPGSATLWAEMARRFAAYQAQVIRPFFRDHFARIDRQVVLVDLLGALARGPEALAELRETMTAILRVFRPGRGHWLDRILHGRRVSKILFAATKADHLHHRQHGALVALLRALLAEAEARAAFSGAETGAMAVAGLRATVEEEVMRDGALLPMVRGQLWPEGRPVAVYAGAVPEDPGALLAGLAKGEGSFLSQDYAQMHFAPPRLSAPPGAEGQGLPHIRLDRAAAFLFGDLL